MTCAVAHYKPRLTGAEWMVIVFYTDLRIFRAASDGGNLGRHKETDHPVRFKHIYWDSVVLSKCQVEKGSNGAKMSEVHGC